MSKSKESLRKRLIEQTKLEQKAAATYVSVYNRGGPDGVKPVFEPSIIIEDDDPEKDTGVARDMWLLEQMNEYIKNYPKVNELMSDPRMTDEVKEVIYTNWALKFKPKFESFPRTIRMDEMINELRREAFKILRLDREEDEMNRKELESLYGNNSRTVVKPKMASHVFNTAIDEDTENRMLNDVRRYQSEKYNRDETNRMFSLDSPSILTFADDGAFADAIEGPDEELMDDVKEDNDEPTNEPTDEPTNRVEFSRLSLGQKLNYIDIFITRNIGFNTDPNNPLWNEFNLDNKEKTTIWREDKSPNVPIEEMTKKQLTKAILHILKYDKNSLLLNLCINEHATANNVKIAPGSLFNIFNYESRFKSCLAPTLKLIYKTYAEQVVSYSLIHNYARDVGETGTLSEIFILLKASYDAKIGTTPMRGSGVSSHVPLAEKYFINRKKLESFNILDLRYSRTKKPVIKPCIVSNLFKTLVLKQSEENTFDKKIYHKLSDTEKHLFATIARCLGIDINELCNDDSLTQQWQVIIGELEAGNDSRILKKKAKDMLFHLVRIGRLSHFDMKRLWNELDL